MSSYCEASQQHVLHKDYHDTEYGFPVYDDDALFARLVLEMNQAGLSWLTILQKKENFFTAYAGLKIAKVAKFGDAEVERLLADAGIIRNKLKIHAAIYNAQQIMALQRQYGSFRAWLDAHHPLDKPAWVKLFKQHFKFTGGEVTGEFLMSTGYLPGAHHEKCPVYRTIAELKPAFLDKGCREE